MLHWPGFDIGCIGKSAYPVFQRFKWNVCVVCTYVGQHLAGSDQPENGLGDGNSEPDCVLAPDGLSFAVRAERQGTEPGGRHYGITIVAMDACGNRSAATVAGTIYVQHDQSPHEDCIKTTGPDRK